MVLDTNVVVAGLRSPAGASAAVLRLLRRNRIEAVANVALVLEYEAVCQAPEHREAAKLSADEVSFFLDALAAVIRPVDTRFLWRPQLRDPGDEFVLEAAVNGQAEAIVTFNLRDFAAAVRFGVEVITPRELVRRIEE